MSGPFPANPNPRQRVTVEIELDEPMLTGAMYNLLHLYAKAYDLDDVDEIYVKLTVGFQGSPYESQLASFKELLKEMPSGRVSKVELIDESGQGRHIEVER